MLEYEIKWVRNAWNPILQIFSYFLLSIGSFYFAIYKNGWDNYLQYILGISLLFMLVLLPTLYIYLQYAKENKNTKLVIDNLKSEIIFRDNRVYYIFKFTDIIKVEKYIHLSHFKSTRGWHPWDAFNYSKITFNDNQSIIISSLLVKSLKLNIDKNRIVTNAVWYPFIRR